MTGPRRFAVPPPGKASWATMVAVVLAPPLAALALMFSGVADPGEERALVIAVLAIPLLIGMGLGATMRRRAILLEGGTLTVHAAMYTRRVQVSSMDLEAARIVDLREQRGMAPGLKTNGFALPGFLAGYFRGGDASPSFALLTDRSRVLVLPVPGDRTLLLSPARPNELLDALRRQARPRTAAAVR